MKSSLVSLLASLAVCSALLSQSLVAFPTIINGSLTGPIANGAVPAGWSTIAGTPDTMDQNNNVGGGTPFGVAPTGASANGGTWVGFANGTSNFQEIFGQLVNGFSVGTSYAIDWYQGNFGAISGPGYTATNSILVTVGGTQAGSGPAMALGSQWSSGSVTFVASAASLQVNFGLTTANINSYLSIDGISIRETQTSGVPDAGTTASLLGLSLLGLVTVRRRLS